MVRQFYWEMVIGIITFLAILKFGPVGSVTFALMVFMPLVLKNQKADEREYYLFYKTGNYTMGLFIIALVIINQLQIFTDSAMIEKNWLNLSINSFLIIHGLTGLVIFHKN